jgi:hypothetical protein
MKLSCQVHAPAALPPGNNSIAHSVGGRMSRTDDLDTMKQKTSLAFPGIRTPSLPARGIGITWTYPRFLLILNK